MDSQTFDRFRKIVYEQSGISLGPHKDALVAARVSKRLRALGIRDFRGYLDYLSNDDTGQELIHFLDVISTNVTSFFREPDHFEFLSRVYSERARKGRKRMTIWSAASSTGEEPYSIAMALLGATNGDPVDARILATDISTRVLENARTGIYREDKLKGLSLRVLNAFFERNSDREGTCYRIKDKVRKMVVFERLNLSKPPFPMRGPFDFIFCRNVMMYFDNDIRGRLLAEMSRLLSKDGYLLVGHAESLTSMLGEFKPVAMSIYAKKGR